MDDLGVGNRWVHVATGYYESLWGRTMFSSGHISGDMMLMIMTMICGLNLNLFSVIKSVGVSKGGFQSMSNETMKRDYIRKMTVYSDLFFKNSSILFI